jgi:DNA-binding response OmpR family regulator
MRERILIVSDDDSASMRESLAEEGFSVTITDDANDAYRQLVESSFDLVVLNLRDATEGLGLIKQIRGHPELRDLLLLTVAEWGTGQGSMALTEGVDGFEPAPLNGQRLVEAVAKLLQPNLTMTARASTAEIDE